MLESILLSREGLKRQFGWLPCLLKREWVGPFANSHEQEGAWLEEIGKSSGATENGMEGQVWWWVGWWCFYLWMDVHMYVLMCTMDGIWMGWDG